ncbi:MAG: hypothetical protein N2037_01110 [Acidimicrobiales bacterium]|nr:hypothetical protein [Acidimicrobiales bacterium]
MELLVQKGIFSEGRISYVVAAPIQSLELLASWRTYGSLLARCSKLSMESA